MAFVLMTCILTISQANQNEMPKQFPVILNNTSFATHGSPDTDLEKLRSFAVPSFSVIRGKSVNISKAQLSFTNFDSD